MGVPEIGVPPNHPLSRFCTNKPFISGCHHLVGGFNHLEKILVNGKDYPIYIYEMENKSHVPNHQPDSFLDITIYGSHLKTI